MKLWTKIRALFSKGRLEREMSAEIQAHLDGLAERNVAKGMSLEEARFAAQRAFGGVEQIKERARDERGIIWLEQLLQDLRYAARQLRKSPGFTLVAVLSLTLGIGANTALFSLVDEVLLRSLPVAKPGELVLFRWIGDLKRAPCNGIQSYPVTDKATGLQTSPFFSYFAFERFRSDTATLSDVFAFAPLGATTVFDGRTANVRGQVTTGNYFASLGVHAVRGRVFTPEDERADAAPAAVISHAFWREHLGGVDDVVGKTIQINKVAFTIVGVTPPGFSGAGEFGEPPAVTLPMAIMPRLAGDMGFLNRPLIWWVNIMGRLRPGVTMATAQAELGPMLAHASEEAWLQGEPGRPGKNLEGKSLPRLQLDSGAQGLMSTRQAYARPLQLLFCIVGGVLLITCLNLANLLLARAVTRRKEIAVRLSLGAGRGRVIRQLITESILLSLLGGLGGFVLAYWGRDALLQVWPIGGGSFAIDFRVLAFAFGLSLFTGLFFGIAPAWQATRLSLDAALKTGAAGATGATRARFRGALMIGQVAIAVVLLTGTGLFLRTLRNFAQVDVGFDRAHLIYFGLDTGDGSATPRQQTDLGRRWQEAVDRLPGVQSSALVARPLLSGSRATVTITMDNPKFAPGQNMSASANEVSPSFFQTLGIPLRLGRTFTEVEVEAGRDVAIINETFARTFFPGENPIGQAFTLPGSSVMRTPDRRIEIVGVTADARYAELRNGIPPTIYQPLTNRLNGTFVVRTAGDPRAIITSLQSALKELAPGAALRNLRTQQEAMDRLLTGERLFALLCSIFALVALALTCLGLYGLLAHNVTARTREIGLRLALGAPVASIMTLILSGGLRLVLIGIVIGLAMAFGVTRFIAAMLFNVPPTDPATFAGVAVVLMAIAFCACWWPARRAAKVNPMEALRCE